MAIEKNITMRQYNGTDYDTLYPQTIASQISGEIPISKGGTGATNAESARQNLGVENAIEPVGTIKATVRTDLGDKWLLCNGETFNILDYPNLGKLMELGLTGSNLHYTELLDGASGQFYNDSLRSYYVNGKCFILCGFISDRSKNESSAVVTEVNLETGAMVKQYTLKTVNSSKVFPVYMTYIDNQYIILLAEYAGSQVKYYAYIGNSMDNLSE